MCARTWNNTLRSEANEIDSHVLLSLIETSLIRHGLTQNALDHSALRVNRDFVERLCDNAKNGRHMLYELGHKVLYSHRSATRFTQ